MANPLLPPPTIEARRGDEFSGAALRCLREVEALEIPRAQDDCPFPERAAADQGYPPPGDGQYRE